MRDRILAVAVLVPLLLLGYSVLATFRSNDRAAASATAEQYLRAACGEADDYGWSLLVHDQARTIFGSRDAYREQAMGGSCSGFTWSLASTTCDDGACFIWLTVPDAASIPAFLADAGIVAWRTDKMPPGANAAMAVLQRHLFGHGVTVPLAHPGS